MIDDVMIITCKHYDNYLGGGCSCYINGESERSCSAGGCGYDREGTVLGNVLKKYFLEEIKQHKAELIKKQYISEYKGELIIDGGVGRNIMVKVFNILGYRVKQISRNNSTVDYVIIKG